jgi:hypothetical protein
MLLKNYNCKEHTWTISISVFRTVKTNLQSGTDMIKLYLIVSLCNVQALAQRCKAAKDQSKVL